MKKIDILKNKINKILSNNIDLTSKEYIIIVLFKILLLTHSRIGNEQYAEENNTYGLTTLLKKHVKIEKDKVFLEFLGKKNIEQHLKFEDKAVSGIIKELLKIPGPRLFKTKLKCKIIK